MKDKKTPDFNKSGDFDKRNHLLLKEDIQPDDKYERIILCHIKLSDEINPQTI
jgi:hypothetical protein